MAAHAWRARRRWVVAGVAVLLIALVPVPWLHAVSDQPAGWTWRLDGRLVVDGEVMNPPGRWSWLTVGRPPMLVEVTRDRLFGTQAPPRDMRVVQTGTQPVLVEPVAAAVGLLHAGWELELGVVVEVTGPRQPGLPDQAVVVEIDGVELRGRADVAAAIAGVGPEVRFRTADGRLYAATGPGLPYDHVRVVDLGPELLTASIGGGLSGLRPVEWFRSLSLGSSHGMMVALVTYAHVSGEDLARGRHVAGTGGVLGDGTVTRIGGLPAKARAARRADADVLLFPASQAGELDGFDARGMQLIGVESLAEAIARLED
jgi:hypothetical protein